MIPGVSLPNGSVLIGPCGIETTIGTWNESTFPVLIGPCGIETKQKDG